MKAAHQPIKFSVSGIRGVVGEAFTPELVIRLARAVGVWAQGSPVALGRDTRLSSPMFHAAVTAGLLAEGCDVVDLGLCPTPLVSYAVREEGLAGGIAVTGSHNEAAWNALKCLGPDGALLNADRGEEVLDIFHASSFGSTPAPGVARLWHGAEDLGERYVDYLLCLLDAERIRERRFRLAADFGNGPVATTAGRFLRKLGISCTALRTEPCGVVGGAGPHVDLCRAVRESDADLGARFTMDGGRITFVTEQGADLSSECTLPLLALQRLRRRPGLLVVNYSTSTQVDAVAASFGQPILRAAVGESHVLDKALEFGAVLAGEGSGGAAALPGTMTFDGLLSLGLVLDLLAHEKQPISTLVETWPKTHMHKGAYRCSPAAAYRAMATLRTAFTGDNPDLTDGIRIEREKGAWLHIRVAHTEPVIRICCEAPDASRADALFRTSRASVQAALKKGRS